MKAHRRNHLVWIGAVVTFVGMVSYFLYFSRFPVLRDFPWLNLPLVGLGAALSGVAAWGALFRPRPYRGKFLASLGFAFSTLIALAFGAYVFWLSYLLPGPTDTTLDLARAPDFALTSMTGERVHLQDLRGRKVVLVFYRGFW